MIHWLALPDFQAGERFLGVHVFERDHVDRAHEMPLMVIGEKRPGWERGGIDVQGPETGQKTGQGNELTSLLVRATRRRCPLSCRGVGGDQEHPGAECTNEGNEGETFHRASPYGFRVSV